MSASSFVFHLVLEFGVSSYLLHLPLCRPTTPPGVSFHPYGDSIWINDSQEAIPTPSAHPTIPPPPDVQDEYTSSPVPQTTTPSKPETYSHVNPPPGIVSAPVDALSEPRTVRRDSAPLSPPSSFHPTRTPSSSRGASQATRSGSSTRYTTSQSTTTSSTLASSSLRAPQRPYVAGSPSSSSGPGSVSYGSKRPKRLKCRSGTHSFERKFGVSLAILRPALLLFRCYDVRGSLVRLPTSY